MGFGLLGSVGRHMHKTETRSSESTCSHVETEAGLDHSLTKRLPQKSDHAKASLVQNTATQSQTLPQCLRIWERDTQGAVCKTTECDIDCNVLTLSSSLH